MLSPLDLPQLHLSAWWLPPRGNLIDVGLLLDSLPWSFLSFRACKFDVNGLLHGVPVIALLVAG